MNSQVNLTQVIINTDLLARTEINEEIINDYIEQFNSGTVFDPIVVFEVDGNYILASGLHRYEVHKRTEQKTIDVIIRQGDKSDIILESITSNSRHGLRFNNREKERCVSLILKEDKWKSWSDNHIAKTCGVSNHFVKKIRNKLFPNTVQTTKTFIRNGQVHTMNTSKIGTVQTQKNQQAKTPCTQTLLNSSISHIVQVIKLYQTAYSDPNLQIPKEFEDEISNFINWYQNRGV
jgi:hypothetical protein